MMNKELLKYVCDETEKHGFALVAGNFVADAEQLEQDGLVEIDPAGKDGAGNIRVAATEDGAEALKPKGFAPPPFFAAENRLDPPIETVAPAVPTFNPPPNVPESAPAANVVTPPVWARPTAPSVVAPVSVDPVPSPSKAVLTAPVPGPNWTAPTVSIAPNVRLVDDVAPPAPKAKRGRTSSTNFPFDQLAVGKAFYIEPTSDVPNPEKKYYSLVRSQNVKYQVPVRDAEGNPIVEMKTRNKNVDGSIVSTQVSRQIMTQEREFAIYAAKDVQGSTVQTGAFVFRLK
jgi:hypothetical protein